jgi:hypothetical protein
MEEEKKKPTLRGLVAKAASETVQLAVAGTAAIGAAALQSWPILALGSVTYSVLVVWDVLNPNYQKKYLEQQKNALPELSQLNDLASKEIIRGLQRARTELQRVLRETPPEVRDHLGTLLQSRDDLEQRAVRLVFRMEELWRYLSTTHAAPIIEEIERLALRARESRDCNARNEFEKARAVREEQLYTMQDIQLSKDRIYAQLSRIEAAVEALPVKIVRMRILDAQAMDALTGEVSLQLEVMSQEVRSFEETLQTLADAPQASS